MAETNEVLEIIKEFLHSKKVGKIILAAFLGFTLASCNSDRENQNYIDKVKEAGAMSGELVDQAELEAAMEKTEVNAADTLGFLQTAHANQDPTVESPFAAESADGVPYFKVETNTEVNQSFIDQIKKIARQFTPGSLAIAVYDDASQKFKIVSENNLDQLGYFNIWAGEEVKYGTEKELIEWHENHNVPFQVLQ